LNKYFGESNEGHERKLNGLADRGFLIKHIHDRVFMCDSCKSWHVNLHESCPSCHSLDWAKRTLYHHFSCGYVGVESEFRKRSFNELYCPKCEERLRHVGLDYEKPVNSFYCNSCGHIFNEHAADSICINCGATAPVDKLLVKEIYSYELSQKAIVSIENNSLLETSFKELVVDSDTQGYTLDYLTFFLENQRTVAQEFGDEIHLLIITSDSIKAVHEFMNEKRTPGYIFATSNHYCIVCGTRGSGESQTEYLKSLVTDLSAYGAEDITATLSMLRLDQEVAGQLDELIAANEKRRDESDADETVE